jgi:hypothetical protein
VDWFSWFRPTYKAELYPGFTYIKDGSTHEVTSFHGVCRGATEAEAWKKAAILSAEVLHSYAEKVEMDRHASDLWSEARVMQ